MIKYITLVCAVALGRNKPDVPAACGNWPQFECRVYNGESKAPCGEYCGENDQCLEQDQTACPYDDWTSSKRADCHQITDPGTCAIAATGPRHTITCLGFCVKYAKDAAESEVIDWESGLCLNHMEICPSAKRKLITDLDDVPCAVRTNCHACYAAKWNNAKDTEPDCIWELNECRNRTDSDALEEFNYGLCPDPRSK